MKHITSYHRWLTMAFLMQCSYAAASLTLSDVRVESTLFQPLNAVITVSADSSNALHVRAIDHALDIHIAAQSAQGSATRVRLISKQAVSMPALTVGISVLGAPNTERQLTLIIMDTSHQVASNNQPPAIANNLIPASLTKQSTAGRHNYISYGPTREGQTLSKIIHIMAPERHNDAEFLSALISANPHAFVSRDPDKLRTGVTLFIPDQDTSGHPVAAGTHDPDIGSRIMVDTSSAVTGTNSALPLPTAASSFFRWRDKASTAHKPVPAISWFAPLAQWLSTDFHAWLILFIYSAGICVFLICAGVVVQGYRKSRCSMNNVGTVLTRELSLTPGNTLPVIHSLTPGSKGYFLLISSDGDLLGCHYCTNFLALGYQPMVATSIHEMYELVNKNRFVAIICGQLPSHSSDMVRDLLHQCRAWHNTLIMPAGLDDQKLLAKPIADKPSLTLRRSGNTDARLSA